MSTFLEIVKRNSAFNFTLANQQHEMIKQASIIVTYPNPIQLLGVK
jgi:hypothetical protein